SKSFSGPWRCNSGESDRSPMKNGSIVALPGRVRRILRDTLQQICELKTTSQRRTLGFITTRKGILMRRRLSFGILVTLLSATFLTNYIFSDADAKTKTRS